MVKVHIIDETGTEIDDELTPSTISHLDRWIVKPYIRTMSSMAEEESDEFEKITDALLEHADSEEIWDTVIDWLNEHHFDHRHLIEKGLALEAPKGMYKEE